MALFTLERHWGYICIMAKRFGFGKVEKLKSRKQIDDLFLTGKSFAAPPLRVIYKFEPATGNSIVQAGVTVNKKYFKRAVDRNRIKRLMREAYRLQKEELVNSAKEKNRNAFLFFIFTDKTIAPFKVVKEAMEKALNRLQKKAGEVNEDHS